MRRAIENIVLGAIGGLLSSILYNLWIRWPGLVKWHRWESGRYIIVVTDKDGRQSAPYAPSSLIFCNSQAQGWARSSMDGAVYDIWRLEAVVSTYHGRMEESL